MAEDEMIISSADNQESSSLEENFRLGGRPPLKTLMFLCAGPVMSEIGSTTYGVVDSVWVNKSFGKSGLSWIGCVFVLQYLVHGFSQMLHVSVASKLGYLHATKAGHKVTRVLFDLFRVALIISMVVPALILPVANPLMKWMGFGEKSRSHGFMFLVPLTAGYFATAMYHLLCGVLQANGLSVYYGAAHLLASVLNMAVFDPLLLLVFKTGIWGVSLATVLSNGVVAICVFVFLKKRNLIPRPNGRIGLCSKFSKHTSSALKSGFSAFVTQVAMTLPTALIQKYLSASAKAQGVSTEVMGVWHIMARVYHICTMVMTALVSAFLPAASYAFGGGYGKRLLQLSLHILWIGTVWAVICTFAFSVYPGEICSIWSSDQQFNDWLKKMIPPSVYTAALTPMRSVVSALLQSMKRGNISSILNFLAQLVALPTFSSILYFTDKDNPVRIVWCYVFTDAFAFVVSLLFGIIPLRSIVALMRGENAQPMTTLLDKT